MLHWTQLLVVGVLLSPSPARALALALVVQTQTLLLLVAAVAAAAQAVCRVRVRSSWQRYRVVRGPQPRLLLVLSLYAMPTWTLGGKRVCGRGEKEEGGREATNINHESGFLQGHFRLRVINVIRYRREYRAKQIGRWG